MAANAFPAKSEPPRMAIPRRLFCLFSTMKKDHSNNAYIHLCSRTDK